MSIRVYVHVRACVKIFSHRMYCEKKALRDYFWKKQRDNCRCPQGICIQWRLISSSLLVVRVLQCARHIGTLSLLSKDQCVMSIGNSRHQNKAERIVPFTPVLNQLMCLATAAEIPFRTYNSVLRLCVSHPQR